MLDASSASGHEAGTAEWAEELGVEGWAPWAQGPGEGEEETHRTTDTQHGPSFLP